MSSTRLAVAVLLACAVSGCAVKFEHAVRPQHVVMVSRRGELLDPRGNRGVGTHVRYCDYPQSEDPDAYIDDVVAAATTSPTVVSPRSGLRVKRVTLYVHGGLNTQLGTVRNAAKLVPGMLGTPHVGHPVIVNWQSSLPSTYFEHLTSIREGREAPTGLGWPLAPLWLATDLATAAVRAPVIYFKSMRTLGASVAGIADEDRGALCRARSDAESGDTSRDIQCGGDVRTGPEKFLSTVGAALWWPIGAVTAPLVSEIGTPSWNNMKRRTTMVFNTPDEFRADHFPDGAQGALTTFLDRLRIAMDEHVRADPDVRGWEMDLIGHSMGAVLVNEILNRHPDLPVKNVVYMAAACRVRDYHEAALSLLERDEEAHVWHLVLHERAELAEPFNLLGFIEVAPRGSLLSWVDSYYDRPDTWLDRTAGRWVNLMATEHLTEHVPSATDGGPRIHIRQFRFGDDVRDTDPQRHGDFNEASYRFWEPGFWKPVADPAACREKCDD